MINWNLSNFKTFSLQKTPSRQLKGRPQDERKYSQYRYLIMDLYTEYMKNA